MCYIAKREVKTDTRHSLESTRSERTTTIGYEKSTFNGCVTFFLLPHFALRSLRLALSSSLDKQKKKSSYVMQGFKVENENVHVNISCELRVRYEWKLMRARWWIFMCRLFRVIPISFKKAAWNVLDFYRTFNSVYGFVLRDWIIYFTMSLNDGWRTKCRTSFWSRSEMHKQWDQRDFISYMYVPQLTNANRQMNIFSALGARKISNFYMTLECTFNRLSADFKRNSLYSRWTC